jgi:two-component system chemotaxis sensor kinase CheA
LPLDLSKYLSLFVSETQERLQALSQDLVRLEAAKAAGEPRGPIVDGIFRAMHSVKGMAASMELDAISRVAHRAEDLADVMRRTPEAVAPRGIDVLLATVDALGVMVAAAAAGQKAEVPQPLLDRLVEARAEAQALALLTAGLAPSAEPPRAEAVAPAGPPPEEAPLEPARGKERRRYKVTVEVSGLCPVPAVRGFLVHKRLCGLGAVLACAPTVEDLRAGRLPGNRLELVVDSAEPADAVRDTLARVSDLTGVAVEDAGPAPVSWPAMAPAPLAPEPPREPAPGTPEGPRTVRVKTELLDYFLDAVGELILATARLREVGKALPEGNRPALDDGVDRLHAIVKDLHDKVMAVRMTPLALVTDRLPRAARDLARRVGKQVEVDVRGAEIELDRAILEELGDPLLHVLRNCVDHGIEEAHLRQLAGKPAAGRVSVAARRERDRVLLEIADDGRGMDPEKLRAAAVRRGAVTPEQAAALTDREALLLSCLPGVSTAESVTDVSGRGVGMDVVKRAVELVGGALEIDSSCGWVRRCWPCPSPRWWGRWSSPRRSSPRAGAPRSCPTTMP